ncbi:YphA family membrane protein [Paenibacillus sp. S-38]|uniref:YphA family membrane protein n=1 Tax=Paenibacillus sp. S-38 TaxID=3416710 RepID=UPI003CE9714A
MSLLLFFMGWLIGTAWSFPVGGQTVNGIVLILTVLAGAVLLRSPGVLLKMHLLSVGMLLASVHFFLRETLPLAPMLVIFTPECTMALLVGLLGAVLLRSPAGQIGAVTLGLLIGEAMAYYAHREAWTGVIDGPSFQDGWWLCVYAVRGCSIVVVALHRTVRSAVRYIWYTLKGDKD